MLNSTRTKFKVYAVKITFLYRKLIYHTTFYYTGISVISGVVRQWLSVLRPRSSFGGVEFTRLLTSQGKSTGLNTVIEKIVWGYKIRPFVDGFSITKNKYIFHSRFYTGCLLRIRPFIMFLF